MTVFPWDATLPPLPRLWAAVELRTVTDWLLGEARANAIAIGCCTQWLWYFEGVVGLLLDYCRSLWRWRRRRRVRLICYCFSVSYRHTKVLQTSRGHHVLHLLQISPCRFCISLFSQFFSGKEASFSHCNALVPRKHTSQICNANIRFSLYHIDVEEGICPIVTSAMAYR